MRARVRAQQARADKQADRHGVGPEVKASGPTDTLLCASPHTIR